MSLTRKLTICFLSIFTFALLTGGMAAWTIRSIRAEADKSAVTLEAASRMNANLGVARFAQRGVILYAMAGDMSEAQTQSQRLQEAVGLMRRAIGDLRGYTHSDAQRRELDVFEAGLNEYVELSRVVVADALGGDASKAVEILKTRSKPIGAKVERAMERMAAAERENGQASMRNAASASTRGAALFGAFVAAALGIGVWGLWVLRQGGRQLNGSVHELVTVSEAVLTASSQLSAGAHELAGGAASQRVSLEAVAASSMQMATLTTRNTDRAEGAAQAMAEVTGQMEKASGRLGEIVGSMQELDEFSGKVKNIIRVIDEIAFQTNILALNAAVEAARAGEAGLGFAVVASEVRSLAQRSATAAKETAEMIEKSVALTQRNRSQVGEVSACIHTITERIAQVHGALGEVWEGSQEQAGGIGDILKAIESLESVTQGTTQKAEESAELSEEFSAQAGSVAAAVARLGALIEGRVARG